MTPLRSSSVVIVALFAWLLLAPTSVGGSTSYVVIHGSSMAPRFLTGDLAVIRASHDYDVGDVVAYHSDLLDTTVMHRIVAVHNGRYTFKGDKNSWLDPERPTRSELIGKLAVRVPQGGVWLYRVTGPVGLGLMAFALLMSGGTVTWTRHRKRKPTMSQHAQRARPTFTLGTLSPNLSSAAIVAAGLGFLGLVVGLFAFTSPIEARVTDKTPSGRSVVFSYTAQVPRSPAYDGTTVHSPDPVFRALADTVEVRYSYQGEPGSVAVTAELSAASGWHSTIPLAGPTTFETDRFDASVPLDLPALERRADRAAAVIGIPADQLTVTVRPRFVTADGTVFEPDLALSLSTTELTAVDSSSLRVKDPDTVTTTTTRQGKLGVLGYEISVMNARLASVALLLLALLTALVVAGLARLGAPTSEGAAIRRQHANLLVRVEPMPTPRGRPVIDVSEFTTLVKLAERYGLLVLHWSRSDVETFVVQDESTTYRYRAAAHPDQEVQQPTEEDPVAPGPGRW